MRKLAEEDAVRAKYLLSSGYWGDSGKIYARSATLGYQLGTGR